MCLTCFDLFFLWCVGDVSLIYIPPSLPCCCVNRVTCVRISESIHVSHSYSHADCVVAMQWNGGAGPLYYLSLTAFTCQWLIVGSFEEDQSIRICRVWLVFWSLTMKPFLAAILVLVSLHWSSSTYSIHPPTYPLLSSSLPSTPRLRLPTLFFW